MREHARLKIRSDSIEAGPVKRRGAVYDADLISGNTTGALVESVYVCSCHFCFCYQRFCLFRVYVTVYTDYTEINIYGCAVIDWKCISN